jgi:cleavage stimulation factor subunit 3
LFVYQNFAPFFFKGSSVITNISVAYLDYLSHLNEDNNTRVLFERILTGGGLTPPNSMDVWNKFLEFESNIGDLAGVIKVERRRAQVLEEAGVWSTDHRQTCQVIDRYRFMNLLPLTPPELKSIGYQDCYSREFRPGPGPSVPGKKGTGLANGAAGTGPTVDPDHIARPDFSQMVPFKPKVNWRPGEFMVPSGGFPLPPAAAELATQLPPPTCFKGPYVIIDKLCDIFDKIRLPDTFQPASGADQHSVQLFDIARSVQWSVGEDGRKRKSLGRGDESDDDDSNISAPTNDIYRKRQQKRIK